MPLQVTLIDFIEDVEILEETKNEPATERTMDLIDYTQEIDSLFTYFQNRTK